MHARGIIIVKCHLHLLGVQTRLKVRVTHGIFHIIIIIITIITQLLLNSSCTKLQCFLFVSYLYTCKIIPLNVHYTPHTEGFLLWNPPFLWKSQVSFTVSFKSFGFWNPPPLHNFQRLSMEGVCGYFLEQRIREDTSGCCACYSFCQLVTHPEAAVAIPWILQ